MRYIFVFICLLFCNILFSQMVSNNNLQFEYDSSGNQIKREFKNNTIIIEGDLEELPFFSSQFEERLRIYPNPTYGKLFIECDREFSVYLSKIEIVSNFGFVQNVSINYLNRNLDVDMTKFDKGVYFVRFYFTDGSSLSKKIIKL